MFPVRGFPGLVSAAAAFFPASVTSLSNTEIFGVTHSSFGCSVIANSLLGWIGAKIYVPGSWECAHCTPMVKPLAASVGIRQHVVSAPTLEKAPST